MGRPKSWVEEGLENGVGVIRFSNWKYFSTFIQDQMLDYNHYVWRGQANSEWLLESTLTRHRRNGRKSKVVNHLNDFKYAVRGRRGNNPVDYKDDNDWWALGQHYGLYTPLLDWSISPYVAAYFAYVPELKEQTEYRAIYAINPASIVKKYKEVEIDKKDQIEFIRPFTDENRRLVSQSGLFSKSPLDNDLESIIVDLFEGHDSGYTLIKFLLPNKNRDVALRQLNRMNINPLTLFPDISGASEYCNNKLRLRNY